MPSLCTDDLHGYSGCYEHRPNELLRCQQPIGALSILRQVLQPLLQQDQGYKADASRCRQKASICI
jgi:hypothetical protein